MTLTQISTAGVKDDAVTSGKIPANAVGSSELADNAVTSAKIADGTIVNADIASNAAIDASKIAGLSTDKINEGNSKVEVVDTGTGYVTTEVDGTEQIRTIPNQTTIKNLRVGENWTMADGSGTGLALSTSNSNDTITGTASNGLEIRSDSIELKQPSSPNNHYAAFNNAGCNFQVANVVKAALTSSGFTFSTDLLSGTDSTYDIGTSANRFANGYFDTLYGDGSNLTGISSVGGSTGVDFNDNVKARFGTGNDLEIYHSGSESFISDTGTGRLTISTNSLHVKNGANNEVMLAANEGGNVELWYANSKKLETTSKGVYINDNFLGVNVNNTTGTPDGRNAFLALGDTDTGMAQNGDGQLEAWANNQEIMNWSTGDITSYKTIVPSSSNSFDLGSTGNRWRNVYTNDLHLSNEGHTNDVDGSWGDWTIQEGESDLFLKNNRSGKKYKFNLTEVS